MVTSGLFRGVIRLIRIDPPFLAEIISLKLKLVLTFLNTLKFGEF
jgi:hypothetical protein